MKFDAPGYEKTIDEVELQLKSRNETIERRAVFRWISEF